MNEIDKFIKDVNITKEQLEAATLNGKVLKFDIDKVELKESKIHGLGIIAVNTIEKDYTIGLATVNNTYKTILGRYTNHSENPNCKFQLLLNGDFIMVALETINVEEELLVDYKDHYLNPSYYKQNTNHRR